MVSKKQRMLVVTVRRDQIACLFFNDKEFIDKQASRKASGSPELAIAKVKAWMQFYRPDVVLSENPDTAHRKSLRNRANIQAIGEYFENHEIFNIWVDRKQTYKNAYEEAEALLKLYPTVQSWQLSKPKIWESEHRYLIYFEALSMALQILDPDYK